MIQSYCRSVRLSTHVSSCFISFCSTLNPLSFIIRLTQTVFNFRAYLLPYIKSLISFYSYCFCCSSFWTVHILVLACPCSATRDKCNHHIPRASREGQLHVFSATWPAGTWIGWPSSFPMGPARHLGLSGELGDSPLSCNEEKRIAKTDLECSRHIVLLLILVSGVCTVKVLA